MNLSKKLVAGALGGLLVAAAASFTPAFAGEANSAAPATNSSATVSGDQSFLAAVSPLLSETKLHKAEAPCKADTLYSNHDVVGEKDACFLSHVDVRSAAIAGNPSGTL